MCHCPAATLLAGPPDQGPSALCGVIVQDREREGLISDSRSEGVLVTARRDPSSFVAYCTGDYIRCPIWRAERERRWREGRRLLDAAVA